MTNDPEQNSAPVAPPVAPEAPAAPSAATAPAAPAAYSAQQPAGSPNAWAPTQPQGQPTNVLAIVSLVASIIGFSLIGVITGHIGLGQIKRTGAPGHGIALAGVIIGYVYIGASLLFLVVWGVIALVYAGTASVTSP